MPDVDQSVPLIGVVHVAVMGRWQALFVELTATMRRSGLYDRLAELHVGVVGDVDGRKPFPFADDKTRVAYRHPDLREHEFRTLDVVRNVCRGRPCRVLYTHLKGVAKDTRETDDWRRYMAHFVIERHSECLARLGGHDTCGVNWLADPWPHYSGNFWWARSEYVCSLPGARDMVPTSWERHSPRHLCERWIGSGRGVRAACLHQSGLNHYFNRYPRERYASTAAVGGVRQPAVSGRVSSDGPASDAASDASCPAERHPDRPISFPRPAHAAERP